MASSAPRGKRAADSAVYLRDAGQVRDGGSDNESPIAPLPRAEAVGCRAYDTVPRLAAWPWL